MRRIFLVLTLAFTVMSAAPALAGTTSDQMIRVDVGTAMEGHPKVTLTVEAVSRITHSSTVTISTSDGTATYPDDYGGSQPSAIRISKGHRFHAFHIAIVDDLVPEPAETFYVTFHGATVEGTTDNTVQVTIEDNDS